MTQIIMILKIIQYADQTDTKLVEKIAITEAMLRRTVNLSQLNRRGRERSYLRISIVMTAKKNTCARRTFFLVPAATPTPPIQNSHKAFPRKQRKSRTRDEARDRENENDDSSNNPEEVVVTTPNEHIERKTSIEEAT